MIYLTCARTEVGGDVLSRLDKEIFDEAYIGAILARKNKTSVNESLCALLLLQKTLSLAEIDTRKLKIRRDENGRPFFEGNDTLDFSISHSEGIVAVALSTSGKVGVDVEKVGAVKDTKRLAARFFSDSENERLKKSTQYENDWTEIWTRKEAYIKYSGIKTERIADVDTECLHDVRFYSETLEAELRDYVICVCTSVENKDKIQKIEPDSSTDN